jgi:hypothetical protein
MLSLIVIFCGNSGSVTHIFSVFFQLLQQKHEHFTCDDIEAFQGAAENFFAKWLELVGYDGVISYMHMFGAKHIRYYLVK